MASVDAAGRNPLDGGHRLFRGLDRRHQAAAQLLIEARRRRVHVQQDHGLAGLERQRDLGDRARTAPSAGNDDLSGEDDDVVPAAAQIGDDDAPALTARITPASRSPLSTAQPAWAIRVPS